MPNVIEFFETYPKVTAQTQEEIRKVFSSALFKAWCFTNENGQVIETYGNFKDKQKPTLAFKGLPYTFLIWDKGWSLQVKKEVFSKGKKIGTILIEKPMSLLDQILINNQDLGISEEKNLCVETDSKDYQCFSSSSQGQHMSFIPHETVLPSSPIYKALNNQKGLMLLDVPNQKK